MDAANGQSWRGENLAESCFFFTLFQCSSPRDSLVPSGAALCNHSTLFTSITVFFCWKKTIIEVKFFFLLKKNNNWSRQCRVVTSIIVGSHHAFNLHFFFSLFFIYFFFSWYHINVICVDCGSAVGGSREETYPGSVWIEFIIVKTKNWKLKIL